MQVQGDTSLIYALGGSCISFCIYILPGSEYRMFFFYIDYWISALIFVKKVLKIPKNSPYF
jgi:hypothetical protein